MGRRSDAKSRLLKSGDQLFRNNGFSAVSVAQLCETASVNKGSFYHFFPSKQALLLEVMHAAWDETAMLQQWESKPPTQPIKQIQIFLKELFAFHYADREIAGRVRGSLVTNIGLEVGAIDPAVASQVSELLEREESAFETVLRTAVNQGELSLRNSAQTAQTLVAYLHGLLMLAKVRDDLSILPAAETGLLRLIGVSGINQ